jgi:hypothetical protein
MRLVRFNRHVEAPSLARLGVVLRDEQVADLRAGYASYLGAGGDAQALEVATVRIPGTLSALVAANALASKELRDVVAWLDELSTSDAGAHGLRGEPLFTPLQECRLHAPVRLTNLFIAQRNYGAAMPTFTMKPSAAVVGPARDIRLPSGVTEVSCAPGLALVIGRGCRDIEASDAIDFVGGYFVMTNVTIPSKGASHAFDEGMHETFAPSGPWLTTHDEVPDAMDLSIEMRVNGRSRRRFSTAAMTWTIPRLVASLSRATLQAGDVIWCGAPDASSDEPPVRLGDEVQSVVEGVGMIRNRVVR